MKSVKTMIFIGIFCLIHVYGARFTVSQDGRGNYTSIQDAVDAARPGDIVEIIDNAVYEEQVTIDSTKVGLTLTSSNPESPDKPTIRYKDTENIQPTTHEESQNDATINFDQNGALQIKRTRNITIDGIGIDGVEHYTFFHDQVWGPEPLSPLYHGNGGITIFISGNVIVRNCDIKNAHFGINVKDRNQGGIFANVNPADIDSTSTVPLSGFGRTGNHLIEKNRLHDNVYGMFFESAWDLGSTVRYNLIYNNHHLTATGDATEDESHHPGGAFEFKDCALTPVAIYNNTFWHNAGFIISHWKVNPNMLVFNNIVGEEDYGAWDDVKGYIQLGGALENRMYHNVFDNHGGNTGTQDVTLRYEKQDPYESETEKVEVYNQYQIFKNKMDVRKEGMVSGSYTFDDGTTVSATSDDIIVEDSGLTIEPFPRSSEVRLYPVPFQSTDPEDPNFLEPDWDDPLVQKHVVDQGWPEAGITDADGTIADLGAIPSCGSYPEDVIRIDPISPILLDENEIGFDVSVLEGSLSNTEIKLSRWVYDLDYPESDDDAPFGDQGNVLGVPEQISLDGSVTTGGNTFPFNPNNDPENGYAFYEVTVQGTGSSGEPVSSTVGFIPYRQLDYKLEVTLYESSAMETEITEVTVGTPVYVHVQAQQKDGTPFGKDLTNTEINLSSGYSLYETPARSDVVDVTTFPGGEYSGEICFTKVPESGTDRIRGAGVWESSDQSAAFLGVSDQITINPGSPAKVEFQDPPSNSLVNQPTVINPGVEYDGELQVYDMYENKVDQESSVDISSDNASIGDIMGAASITTDNTGLGTFQVEVTNGSKGDVFTLLAEVSGLGEDDADMEVGAPLDQIWIFYNDVGDYNPLDSLVTNVGEKVKATIWVSRDGETPVSTRDNVLKLQSSQNLEFYEIQDATVPVEEVTLENGTAEVWITSQNEIINGGFRAYSETDNTLYESSMSMRDNIFVHKPAVKIDSANIYDSNGDGAADSLSVFYADSLFYAPDSIAVFWPDKSTGERRSVSSGSIAMDAQMREAAFSLDPEFQADITSGSPSLTSWNPITEEGTPEVINKSVTDRVGPVLTKGILQENFDPSASYNIEVTFSEEVKENFNKEAFTLIKADGSGTYDLDVSGFTAVQNKTSTISVSPENGFTIEAGDSLKILSDGPVQDNSGNRAHPDNPAVALSLKKRPVPVSAASYFDRNADGRIDSLSFSFMREVDTSNITFSVKDSRGNSAENLVIFDDNGDNTSFSARFSGMELFTGGRQIILEHHQVSSEFDTLLSATAEDKAAPVIESARYYQRKNEDDNTRTDSLEVEFTESVDMDAFSLNSNQSPFNLFSLLSTIEGYSIELSSASSDNSNKNLTFVVDTLIGISYPANNDSINISAENSIVSDAQGNVQENPENIKRAMTVEPKPYEFNITARSGDRIENLIIPPSLINRIKEGITIEHGVNVTLFPKDARLEGVDIEKIKASIFDHTGNLIGELVYDDIINRERQYTQEDNVQIGIDENTGGFAILWNGRNSSGRRVGSGSYLMRFEYRDSDGKSNNFEIFVGIKK